MQIANYVTPNIFIIVQKSPKSLAAEAELQTPLGELGAYSAPPDPLAALGWDGDFKTLYPPPPPVKKSWVRACRQSPHNAGARESSLLVIIKKDNITARATIPNKWPYG